MRPLERPLLVLVTLGLILQAACSDDPAPAAEDATSSDSRGDSADDEADSVDSREAAQALVLGVEESESWTLPGLDGEVHVLRTEGNVAHIYATTVHDLYMVQGFILGRDRYFEFELGRRLSLGEVSAILGDLALSVDLESRGQGLTQIVDRVLDQLPPEQEAIFAAFAEGINVYIDAVSAGDLPPPTEFDLAGGLLGMDEPSDLMQHVDVRGALGFMGTIVAQLGYESIDVGQSAVAASLETLYAEDAPLRGLRQAGIDVDIWQVDDPVHPVASAPDFGLERGADDAEKRGRAGTMSPSAALLPARPVPATEATMLSRLLARQDRFLDRLGRDDPNEGYGSNAWAVSSLGTAEGGAVLAGDGHLPLDIPSIFYQIGMDLQVFGDDDYSVAGLVFPGLPVLGVGTNGHVAWSQTYLAGDITDWYAEELRLDDNGLPEASLFRGEWEPLVAIEETYEIADIPLLSSEGRTETWTRYATFDGRLIAEVEGFETTPARAATEGHPIINLMGTWVSPTDLDDDSVISAISFDYTGFDIGDTIGSVLGFGTSRSVEEFRESTRDLVVYAQNVVAADRHGDVYYSGFNATPCREYLPRDEDGRWLPGADPRQLLDGTTYGGFTIPINDDLTVDYGAGEDDPYRCVISLDDWPASLSPDRGFVMTANNDPGAITLDGALHDDPFYIGGPWAPGFRAEAIDSALAEIVTDRSATVATMAELQANHRSNTANRYLGAMLALVPADGDSAVEVLEGLDSERFADLGAGDADLLEEAVERLNAWIDDGLNAQSGVETFYNSVDDQERADAVATMIYAEWLRALVRLAIRDEGIDGPLRSYSESRMWRLLAQMLDGRGPDNPLDLAHYNPDTEESVYWDILGTETIETGEEVAVLALFEAVEALRKSSVRPGRGGFGTDDMDEWLWGLRHMVAFESIIAGFVSGNPAVDLITPQLSISPSRLPLADSIPPGDPRRGLQHFPRPGDYFAVDAANPGLGGDYVYTSGPVMRMVIHLGADGRISGQNVIPGGQSSLTDSPFFDDQAALWLANETVPLRYHVEDVVAGAVARERYTP